jgi:hypothetical protein
VKDEGSSVAIRSLVDCDACVNELLDGEDGNVQHDARPQRIEQG